MRRDLDETLSVAGVHGDPMSEDPTTEMPPMSFLDHHLAVMDAENPNWREDLSEHEAHQRNRAIDLLHDALVEGGADPDDVDRLMPVLIEVLSPRYESGWGVLSDWGLLHSYAVHGVDPQARMYERVAVGTGWAPVPDPPGAST